MIKKINSIKTYYHLLEIECSNPQLYQEKLIVKIQKTPTAKLLTQINQACNHNKMKGFRAIMILKLMKKQLSNLSNQITQRNKNRAYFKYHPQGKNLYRNLNQ